MVAVARRQKQIVLGVTGSIAAYKAGDIIRRLQDEGFAVSVIMTQEAEKFITPLTLAALSGGKVYRKLFDSQAEAWEDRHVGLAQRADAVLIAPATANIIAKIAAGIADDLLTCTALATQAPVLIAPAMNTGMLKNSFTRENFHKLKKNGIQVIETTSGRLASGISGEGHLADISAIVKKVKATIR